MKEIMSITGRNKHSTSLSIFEEEAGSVHLAHEELEADDGVDDDDEQNKQSDVQEGNHGFNDGVQHHL